MGSGISIYILYKLLKLRNRIFQKERKLKKLSDVKAKVFSKKNYKCILQYTICLNILCMIVYDFKDKFKKLFAKICRRVDCDCKLFKQTFHKTFFYQLRLFNLDCKNTFFLTNYIYLWASGPCALMITGHGQKLLFVVYPRQNLNSTLKIKVVKPSVSRILRCQILLNHVRIIAFCNSESYLRTVLQL